MGKKVSAVKMDFLVVVVVFFSKATMQNCVWPAAREEKQSLFLTLVWVLLVSGSLGGLLLVGKWVRGVRKLCLCCRNDRGQTQLLCSTQGKRSVMWGVFYSLWVCRERGISAGASKNAPKPLGTVKGRSTNQPCNSRELFGAAGGDGLALQVPPHLCQEPLGFGLWVSHSLQENQNPPEGFWQTKAMARFNSVIQVLQSHCTGRLDQALPFRLSFVLSPVC